MKYRKDLIVGTPLIDIGTFRRRTLASSLLVILWACSMGYLVFNWEELGVWKHAAALALALTVPTFHDFPSRYSEYKSAWEEANRGLAGSGRSDARKDIV